MTRRLLLALPFLPLAWTPAGATASLTCEADDRHVAVSLQGNVGRGDAAAVQITSGSIKLKAVRGSQGEIEFPTETGHLVQQWALGNELRLGIQPGEVNGVTVYLAVIAQRTKSGDTDRYRGHYVLKVQGPQGARELKGRIKGCEAG